MTQKVAHPPEKQKIRPTERNQAIEGLRVVAAFAIVWFHAKATPGHHVAYAGLVVFLMLSAYFASIAANRGPGFLLKFTKRIMLPWAAWFAIYLAINIAIHKPALDPHDNILLGVLAGPRIHLWYLPFIYVVVIAITYAKNYASATMLAGGAFALALLTMLTGPLWAHLALQAPLPQYANALTSVLAGILLGAAAKSRIAIWLFHALIAAALVLCLTGQQDLIEPYLIGMLATYVAIRHGRALIPSWLHVNRLSDLTFGTYLAHPIFLSLFKPLIAYNSPVGIFAVFAASMAATCAAGYVASFLILSKKRRTPQAQLP